MGFNSGFKGLIDQYIQTHTLELSPPMQCALFIYKAFTSYLGNLKLKLDQKRGYIY